MRREVAARRLICWRLCGSSACTTGGSTARCWRSPWPPTTCGGRALPREQGGAGGSTTITTTAGSSLPPLPLPPRPRPHPPLPSRTPARTRPAMRPASPLTDPLVRITDPRTLIRCALTSPPPLSFMAELEWTLRPLPVSFLPFGNSVLTEMMAPLSIQVLSLSHLYTFHLMRTSSCVFSCSPTTRPCQPFLQLDHSNCRK